PAQAAILNSLEANPDSRPIPCVPAISFAAQLPPAFCASVLQGALTSKQSTIDLFKTNSGVFPFTTHSKAFSLRLDHTMNSRSQIFLRYNYTNVKEGNLSTR